MQNTIELINVFIIYRKIEFLVNIRYFETIQSDMIHYTVSSIHMPNKLLGRIFKLDNVAKKRLASCKLNY